MVETQKRIFHRFTFGAPLRRVWATPVKFGLAFSPPPMETKGTSTPRKRKDIEGYTPFAHPPSPWPKDDPTSEKSGGGGAPPLPRTPKPAAWTKRECQWSVTQVKLVRHANGPQEEMQIAHLVAAPQSYRLLPYEHSSCGHSPPARCWCRVLSTIPAGG